MRASRPAKAPGADKVFSEEHGGAETDGAALERVLAALESGDVLMVSSLKVHSPNSEEASRM